MLFQIDSTEDPFNKEWTKALKSTDGCNNLKQSSDGMESAGATSPSDADTTSRGHSSLADSNPVSPSKSRSPPESSTTASEAGKDAADSNCEAAPFIITVPPQQRGTQSPTKNSHNAVS